MTMIGARVTSLVNILIQAHTDRIRYYKYSLHQLAESFDTSEFQTLFMKLIHESRRFNRELIAVCKVAFSDYSEPEPHDQGKVFSSWQAVRDIFGEGTAKSILKSCEYGEELVAKAYQEVLKQKDYLPNALHGLLIQQYDAIKNAHLEVREHNDHLKYMEMH